jgi:hypothetical protein
MFDDQSLKVPLCADSISPHHLQLGEPDQRILGPWREGILDHDPEVITLRVRRSGRSDGAPEQSLGVRR